MFLLSIALRSNIKLVVANNIEEVVALLSFKVTELFSFQDLLCPLLVPRQDRDCSVGLSVLSFCPRPSSAKIHEPFPKAREAAMHCYLLILTTLFLVWFGLVRLVWFVFFFFVLSSAIIKLMSFSLRFERDEGQKGEV